MVIISGVVMFLGLIIAALCVYLGITPTQISGQKPNIKKWFFGAGGSVVFSIIITVTILFGVPSYHVWEQNKQGEAELARAEQNRQIAIQEAKAKEESAKSLANARIIEAEGISEANRIIGNSLTNNDAYIHYLWIEALKESKDQVIYVPTEAGIPLTESTRFLTKPKNQDK